MVIRRVIWLVFLGVYINTCRGKYKELEGIDRLNENGTTTVPGIETTKKDDTTTDYYHNDITTHECYFGCSPSTTVIPTIEPEQCIQEDFTDKEGNFSIPKGRDIGDYTRYRPLRDCIWTVTVKKGLKLEVNITDIDIEYAINCIYDALEIYDGPSENSTLLARICGRHEEEYFQIVRSSTHQLFFRFRSDSEMSGRGFMAIYKATDCFDTKVLQMDDDRDWFKLSSDDKNNGIEKMLLGNKKKFTGPSKADFTFHVEAKSKDMFQLLEANFQTRYANMVIYSFPPNQEKKKKSKTSKNKKLKMKIISVKNSKKWNTAKISSKTLIQKLAVSVIWDTRLKTRKEGKIQIQNLMVKVCADK